MRAKGLHLKTSQEVLRDMRMFLATSIFGNTLRGTIYLQDERPADATTEDAVLTFLTGEDTLLQRGTVVCNIYFNDIVAADGHYVIDKERAATLLRAFQAFLDMFPCADDYQLSTDATATVMTVDNNYHQHYIYTRIKFYRRAS